MQSDLVKRGAAELRQVRKRSRGLYWAVALFSLFANLLMLTGPLYMLQVYDRVLGSGSEETLIALSVLVVFLYGVMGLLDYTRGRIMARVGARFQADLDRRVFDAVVRKSAVAPDIKTNAGLADLEAVQRLMTSPVLMAAFDAPWTPIFFAAIFLFHPMLGWLAVGAEERNKLWQARHDAYWAIVGLRPGCKAVATDVCVPISRLAEAVTAAQARAAELGLIAPIVGHAGDGNFHASLLVDMENAEEVARGEAFVKWLAELAISMDGTCTGEHGIGQGKRSYLTKEMGGAVDVMKTVKAAFDPHNILNPGKILPE